MGLMTRSLALVQRKSMSTMGAMIPTWQMATQQLPDTQYENFARDGYRNSDVAFACIEELATSAAEPYFVGVRANGDEREHVTQHKVLDILRRPNRFASGFEFIATIIRHLSIAGNAYIIKVRSGAGVLTELWLIRPDRMRVLPDRVTFVKGYRYINGDIVQDFALEDVIHIKNFSSRNDFYGDPPLLAVAEWIDIDSWMRKFVKAFFQNAGVPSGIISTERMLQQNEKEAAAERWRAQFSGPGGWNKVAVFEANTVTYTPMGLPLGGRGLVIPELEEIATARIGMAFRVPPSILGTRLGLMKGNYASREADFQTLWLQTLVPLYRRISDALNAGLFGAPERGIPAESVTAGLDGIEFDMSNIKALREDDDALHNRWRSNYTVAMVTREEARQRIGLPPEIDPSQHIYVPLGATIEEASQVDTPALPAPLPPGLPPAPKGGKRLRL